MYLLLCLCMLPNFILILTSSADINSIVATFSHPCQTFFKDANTAFNSTDSCQTESLLWASQYIVGVGFCTEFEFNNLTSAVCNKTVSQTTSVSDARKSFYAALNTTSGQCQNMTFSCIMSSAVSILYKQQEKFCPLMSLNISSLNFESCLISVNNTGCTQADVKVLKAAACSVNSTSVDQTFSTAVLGTTSKCQGQMATCALPALELVVKGKYCDVMNYKYQDVTREACLKMDNACTGPEIEQMKTAACIPQISSVIANFSQACQRLMQDSNYQSQNSTEVCLPEQLTWGFQYLVRSGFCTEIEFNNLTSTLCGKVQSQTTAVSEARKNFYNTLNKLSSNCQYKTYTCILSYPVSIVYKQQEQFCSLMSGHIFGGSTLESCLVTPENDGCTQNEFNQLKTAACASTSTNIDQTFSKTILSTTAKCQSQITTCSSNSFNATTLIIMEKYCDALNFKDNNITTEACLKMDNICTVAESDKLKLAACNPKILNVIAVFSPVCQRLLQDTSYESQNSSEVCKSEQLNWGFQYIVRSGFCTEIEFNNLTSTLCGKMYSQTTAVSDARKDFYNTLNKLSSSCQYKTYTCILSYPVSIVYKQQEQFCSLMSGHIFGGSTLESCLVTPENDGCTQNEFNQLKTAACASTSTNVDQTFSKTVLSTTAKCQTQITSCSSNSFNAGALFIMEKYCDALNFKYSNITTEACLKMDNICTVAESDKMKVAACSLATTKTFNFMLLCLFNYTLMTTMLMDTFF